MQQRHSIHTLLLFSLLTPGLALATNGYFSHGYGIKSQGIAGIGIALPQDSLAAATNPAGTAFIGNRADIGVTWFQPRRGSKIRGNTLGPDMSADGTYSGNGTEHFIIPDMGYVRQISPTLAAGIALYGNGGMNTHYRTNPFQAYGSSGSAGVDLSQLFISPSLAYKVNEDHAIGLALNFAYQRFKARGLQAFSPNSSSPENFTNRGTDTSTGWGIRLGYTGNITPDLTLGVTWASKTRMNEFDRYKGLFAEQGGFDIPADYGIGIAYQATPSLTLAADIHRIEYSKVRSVGNALDRLFTGALFGSSNGPGFGWRDVTTYKVGTSYALNSAWTLRGGYSHATQPVPRSQTLLNILSPGVIQDHLSIGASWKHNKQGELSFALTHGFKKTVRGRDSMTQMGGGEADIHLEETIMGLSYGWDF